MFTATNLWSSTNPWQGRIRPGFMAGNNSNDTDYFLDVLLPAYGTEKGLLFVNPHLRLDDNDGDEENIGIGYRQLLMNDSLILGVNAYYDTMNSQYDERYKQWGVGLEAMSTWVDFRSNYYHPFDDRKKQIPELDKYSFGSNALLVNRGYEEALRGFDAEVGVLVPFVSDYVETRVYGGGYWYNSDLSADIDGWKVRVEARPMQLVNLSLEFKDDDVKSATFIGGYFDIPFSIGELVSGNNPFKGISDVMGFGTGTRSLSERMVEKVVRDRHITAHTYQDETPEKTEDMIYVNADNPNSGTGTYEDPYQDISSVPADSLYSNGTWIYVFSSDSTADTYNDVNFTLLPKMVLWGQGYYHPVFRLGGGPNPILDGGGGEGGDVITLADYNEVMGLTIQNGDAGIYGNNIRGTNIHHNLIRNNGGGGTGIHIENYFSAADISGMNLTYIFDSNQIIDNDGEGISLETEIEGDDSVTNSSITNVFTNNTITGNTSSGVYLYNDIWTNNDNADITNTNITNTFSDNTISGNEGVEGYNYIGTFGNNSGVDNSRITNTFSNNTITGNSSEGVYLESILWTEGDNSSISDSSIGNAFSGNTVEENIGGVYVYNELYTDIGDSSISDSTITNTFTNNTLNSNTGGLGIENWIDTDYGESGSSNSGISNVSITNTITNNTIDGNGFWGGFWVYNEFFIGSSDAELSNSGIANTFTNNTITGNGDDGVYVENYFITVGLNSGINNSSISDAFTGNTISGNSNDGLHLYSEIFDSAGTYGMDTTLFMQGNTVTNNGNYGVYLDYDIDGTFAGDLGGGLLGSAGNNSFYGNAVFDIYNNAVNGLKAENNWWGDTDPSDQIDGGGLSVDYDPWLTSAP